MFISSEEEMGKFFIEFDKSNTDGHILLDADDISHIVSYDKRTIIVLKNNKEIISNTPYEVAVMKMMKYVEWTQNEKKS